MTALKIFNTLTGKKEDFVPLNPGRVLMYACGPTVYDLSHLGHARMALTFDVIQRYLRFSGYEVTFVRNITDIDDKIINRAKELKVRPEALSRHFTYTFWKDMDDLNAASPDVEPRATEYIQQMIGFADDLIKKGFAYQSQGDVYFDVAAFKDYGKLKKQSLEDLMHGAREGQVRSQDELKELKKNPVDFALWKSAATTETGWQSPWGWGRPGWHLECSSMIQNVLGETIDIHGGGEDLVFPHHTNEVAQSESLNGKPLARYWIHNSFVQVESEKMSKSLGNFQTIQTVLSNYSPDTVRLFVLQTHYRSPIEFTTESMEAAKTGTSRLLRAARYSRPDEAHDKFEQNGRWQNYLRGDHPCLQSLRSDAAAGEVITRLHNDFVEAMDNDFNTPQAISALFQLADTIFSSKDAELQAKYAAALKAYASVLGLRLHDTGKIIDNQTGSQLVETLLDLRDQARANKDYKQSDQIRDALLNIGIKVMDVKGARAQWERE